MGHLKRILVMAYLLGFVLVDSATTLFAQYPPLLWLGLVGVVAILVDAARCARCHWRRLKDEAASA